MNRNVQRSSSSDRSSSSKSRTLKHMQADPVVTNLYERMEELTQRLDEEQTLLDLIDLHAEASNIPGMHDITDFVPLALDDLATPQIAAELRARAEHDSDPWLRSEYAEWLKMPSFRAIEAKDCLLDVMRDGSQPESKLTRDNQEGTELGLIWRKGESKMGKSKKNKKADSTESRPRPGNPYRGQVSVNKLSTAERDKKISKLMSMMLRHSPEEFGLTLDPEDGSCGLDELLEAVRRRTGYEQTTEEDIRGVVRRSDKQRFEIVEKGEAAVQHAEASDGQPASEISQIDDASAVVAKPHQTYGESSAEASATGGSRIRARYGHSFGRVSYPQGTPPNVLYHGTSRHALPSIAEHGLLPMGREYVHLSADTHFAALAGRRKGKLVMLRLDTEAAAQVGVVFYDAGSGVWLAERIPPGLMEEDHDYEDKPQR